MPNSLLDVPFGEWGRVLELPEKETYRVKQIQEWVFARRAKSFDDMTSLPALLRVKLKESFSLRALKTIGHDVSQKDGSSRMTFETGDKKTFSSVILPSRSRETGEERLSLCLSTQIGCAWRCAFCASGKVHFVRNLFSSEIMEQVMCAEDVTGKKVDSLLFMGMGEPLANYHHVLWALRCLRSPLGFGYGARHVTVSTSGLVPQILKLSQESPKVNLAVSLHAADDETRRKIMPKSSWSVQQILKSVWAYQKQMGNVRVTFEYVLLKGLNDSLRTAQRLSNMLRGRNVWINLIEYNPVPGLAFQKASRDAMEKFEGVLTKRGLFVRMRKPQGADIKAGCGQLSY